MILRPGQAGVAVRAADDEATGRIDQVARLLVEQMGRHDWRDDVLAQRALISSWSTSGACWVLMTMVSTRTGLAVVVLDGHLALAVGRSHGSVPFLRTSARRRHQAVGQRDGHRHQLGRLVAGEAEHHALVAGAGVEVVVERALFGFQRLVDAERDVDRLARQHDLDVGVGRSKPYSGLV